MLRIIILAIAVLALIFAARWYWHSAPSDPRPRPPAKSHLFPSHARAASDVGVSPSGAPG